jgi:hypothetical protein
MTMPIAHQKQSSRSASWSSATRFRSPSRSSARRRTPPSRSTSTQGRCRRLFTSTGASRFSDPQNTPWTIAFNPNYQSEGRIYAKYILNNHPDAKIGIFYQNDDFGKDYLNRIRTGLGDKAATKVVAEASYEVSDPTIDSQILKIKSAGASCSSAPRRRSKRLKQSRRSPNSAGIRSTFSISTLLLSAP